VCGDVEQCEYTGAVKDGQTVRSDCRLSRALPGDAFEEHEQDYADRMQDEWKKHWYE
jgi:hypothetical protein